jgi:hypothetical protein
MALSLLYVDRPKLGGPVIEVPVLTWFIMRGIGSRAGWLCGYLMGMGVLVLGTLRHGEFTKFEGYLAKLTQLWLPLILGLDVMGRIHTFGGPSL